jgi:hypothetical protein
MIEFLWAYFIFVLYIPQFVDRDNVIGIETRFELDGPGIEFWWGRDFPHLSRTALGSTQLPVQWVPVLFAGSNFAVSWP